MVSYADSGFLFSLYVEEKTTKAAEVVMETAPLPIAITPLSLLELRNALNFSVMRRKITRKKRDGIWSDLQSQITSGFYQLAEVSQAEIYDKARELSDKHTPVFGTRSLDLMHVAAALLSKARVFLTFDERQSKAAKMEGLKVAP